MRLPDALSKFLRNRKLPVLLAVLLIAAIWAAYSLLWQREHVVPVPQPFPFAREDIAYLEERSRPIFDPFIETGYRYTQPEEIDAIYAALTAPAYYETTDEAEPCRSSCLDAHLVDGRVITIEICPERNRMVIDGIPYAATREALFTAAAYRDGLRLGYCERVFRGRDGTVEAVTPQGGSTHYRILFADGSADTLFFPYIFEVDGQPAGSLAAGDRVRVFFQLLEDYDYTRVRCAFRLT